LDEEKSKNVGLAQQNGFDPTFFFQRIPRRLAKGTAQTNIKSTQLSSAADRRDGFVWLRWVAICSL